MIVIIIINLIISEYLIFLVVMKQNLYLGFLVLLLSLFLFHRLSGLIYILKKKIMCIYIYVFLFLQFFFIFYNGMYIYLNRYVLKHYTVLIIVIFFYQ